VVPFSARATRSPPARPGPQFDSRFHPSFETRPSQFNPPRRITPEELADWPFRVQEASLWINSALAEEALESARLDWLLGNEASFRESPCTFNFFFDQWGDFGMPMLHVRLLIGGDDFTVTSGGLPLDIDEWAEQYEAWWKGWKNHWDSKVEATDDESSEYDTAIPAGKPEPPDLSYRPPDEPVFDLEPTDAPHELVHAIREYFESHHHRDWATMARVYPYSILSAEERAKQLERQNLTDDFGRWGFIRSIDDWWQEGSRACVVVRGIEHQMAFEEYPAKDCESVWTFSMRYRGGGWIIHGYSQGWPAFGSAKQLSLEQKPWLKRWKSGSIA
jgi:hypothetical protein